MRNNKGRKKDVHHKKIRKTESLSGRVLFPQGECFFFAKHMGVHPCTANDQDVQKKWKKEIDLQ
jgi:hypothetical protein